MRHFIRKSSSCDTMKDIIFYLFFYLLFLRPRFLSTSWCIQFCEMHSVYHQILLLLREKDIFLTVALLLQVLFLKDTYLIFKIIFTALEIILETGIPGESLPPPPPVRSHQPDSDQSFKSCLSATLRFQSSATSFPFLFFLLFFKTQIQECNEARQELVASSSYIAGTSQSLSVTLLTLDFAYTELSS